MPEIPFWFPFATLLAGWFLKALSDKWDHSRAAQRAREERTALRRSVLADQRTAFQRQTILELQEAAHRLLRSTSQINMFDVMNNRGRPSWVNGLVGKDLDEATRLAFATVTMLSSRVRDPEIRRLASELTLVCSDVQLATSEEESNALQAASGRIGELFNARVGAVLRDIERIEEEGV